MVSGPPYIRRCGFCNNALYGRTSPAIQRVVMRHKIAMTYSKNVSHGRPLSVGLPTARSPSSPEDYPYLRPKQSLSPNRYRLSSSWTRFFLTDQKQRRFNFGSILPSKTATYPHKKRGKRGHLSIPHRIGRRKPGKHLLRTG